MTRIALSSVGQTLISAACLTMLPLAEVHGSYGISLRCPGDINGDLVPELVLVSGTNPVRVQVKDLTGAWINEFEVTGNRTADAELMPDTDTNGAPELVILHSLEAGGTKAPPKASVRDLLTGADRGTVTFSEDLARYELEVELVPDQTGNGIPEFAVLGRETMRVETRDGMTGALVRDVRFSRYLTGDDLTIYPGLGNSAELAVLGENGGGSDVIEVRDLSTGAIVRQIWLGSNWSVWDQELLTDLNGNGSKEVAILRSRRNPAGGPPGYYAEVNVQIRDSVTGAWVHSIGFPKKYVPLGLASIPDLNGNAADEVVVFAERYGGPQKKVIIKDSRTSQKLAVIWYSRRLTVGGLVDCGDINGNGANDLAVWAFRRDGRMKVIVTDSRTTQRLASVWFD